MKDCARIFTNTNTHIRRIRYNLKDNPSYNKSLKNSDGITSNTQKVCVIAFKNGKSLPTPSLCI